MRLVEREGVLYRGAEPAKPSEVWNYAAKTWVRYHQGWDPAWGTEISEERAEVLKYDSPDALHYMYYDIPPWSQPLSDAYREQVMPSHIQARRRAAPNVE